VKEQRSSRFCAGDLGEQKAVPAPWVSQMLPRLLVLLEAQTDPAHRRAAPGSVLTCS